MGKIGFGIVGCGNIGPVHAQALAQVPGAKLVGVADVVQASAERLAQPYGAAAYGDYRAMLERKDLHAVCLCVPSGLRMEIALACAAAGKHVLSEKPLEVTTKRIDRIVEACGKAGVLLGCIFQSRFADDVQRIRRALDEGRFGTPVLGDAYIKWYRSEAYYASGAWRGTWKLDGGGALMNQGIHQIDLLQWFMGPVKSVRAQTTRRVHRGIEVEDTATAMLEFASGAFGCIEGSTAIWKGHPARIEIHGTDGTAVTEDGKLVLWEFRKPKASDKAVLEGMRRSSELGSGAGDPLKALGFEGHRRNIADFADAIKRDRPPRVDGREGRHAVALIEAIYTAARTGRTVKL